MHKFILGAAMLLMTPLLAFADPSAAVNYRSNVPSEAKLIYDRVLPLVIDHSPLGVG